MEDHKKMFYTQILIEVEEKVIKPHFEVVMKAHTVDFINRKINFMEVD
jgi:hypothetical protein